MAEPTLYFAWQGPEENEENGNVHHVVEGRPAKLGAQTHDSHSKQSRIEHERIERERKQKRGTARMPFRGRVSFSFL